MESGDLEVVCPLRQDRGGEGRRCGDVTAAVVRHGGAAVLFRYLAGVRFLRLSLLAVRQVSAVQQMLCRFHQVSETRHQRHHKHYREQVAKDLAEEAHCVGA